MLLASSTDERHCLVLPCSLGRRSSYPRSSLSSPSTCVIDVLDAVALFSLPSEQLLLLRVRPRSELPAHLPESLSCSPPLSLRRYIRPSSLSPSSSFALLCSSFPPLHACLSYHHAILARRTPLYLYSMTHVYFDDPQRSNEFLDKLHTRVTACRLSRRRTRSDSSSGHRLPGKNFNASLIGLLGTLPRTAVALLIPLFFVRQVIQAVHSPVCTRTSLFALGFFWPISDSNAETVFKSK